MALFWLVVWLITFRLLYREWAYAERWLLLSGVTLAFLWWRIRQNLSLNTLPDDDHVLPTLGPGNQITVFRGLLLGLLAGFVFSPWPQGGIAWLIAGIYTLASLADGFDGYAARRSNQTTRLGQLLDMELDGLGVAIVSLLAVGYGQLPAWFLLVGFARYLFVGGLWWRERIGATNYAMPGSIHRRILAGMLMGMMTVVLWPIVPAAMSHIAGAVIGIPVLLGFLRDWLFACGRLNDQNAAYQRLRRLAYLLLTRWLPPLWRLSLAVAIFVMLNAAKPWVRPAAWEALLRSWGLPGASLLASFLALTAVIGAIMVGLGILGRLWAILLLLPIGFDISTAGLTWPNGVALVCALLITLCGSGPFSLWRPEEALMVQHGHADDDEVVRGSDPVNR